jgi:hypothetical protein
MQPLNIQPRPGIPDGGVAGFAASGDSFVSGALTVGRGLVIAASAAPVQTAQAVTLYTVDGENLLSIGNSGVAHSVGAAPVTVRQTYLTTGAVTFNNDATFTRYSAVEQAIPAAVGDWVEFKMVGMWQPAGSDFLDLAVVVGTTMVRYSSSGASSPTIEGDPSLYSASGFVKMSGEFAFSVTNTDLDGGNVRFTLAHKGAAGGTLYSNANYPLRLYAKNLHTVT